MRTKSKATLVKTNSVAVVINGNANQVTNELIKMLHKFVQKDDLFISRNLDEGRENARKIVAQQYPVVLTGGGDGTFVQMVTWIMRDATYRGQALPRFGLLKLGTGNSLASVLGAANTYKGIFVDLNRAPHCTKSHRLPLIEVQDMLTPFAGSGADALGIKHFQRVRTVVRKIPLLKKHGTGALSYAISIPTLTVPELLTRGKLHVRIINRGNPVKRLDAHGRIIGQAIQNGEVIYKGACRATLISTIPSWGYGVRVFPFADERRDQFCLRVVNVPLLKTLTQLPSIWKGTYRHPELLDFYADNVEFYFDRQTEIEIGGDYMKTVESMRAQLYPETVEVIDYGVSSPTDLRT